MHLRSVFRLILGHVALWIEVFLPVPKLYGASHKLRDQLVGLELVEQVDLWVLRVFDALCVSEHLFVGDVSGDSCLVVNARQIRSPTSEYIMPLLVSE